VDTLLVGQHPASEASAFWDVELAPHDVSLLQPEAEVVLPRHILPSGDLLRQQGLLTKSFGGLQDRPLDDPQHSFPT